MRVNTKKTEKPQTAAHLPSLASPSPRSHGIIGFYKHMFFVYLSLFLITFIFFKISDKVNSKNLFIFGFLGSLIFFLVSNFGVWASGVLSPITNLPYEKNLNGLINCYFLAIPFFTKTLISTIFFSYVAYLTNYSLKKRFA